MSARISWTALLAGAVSICAAAAQAAPSSVVPVTTPALAASVTTAPASSLITPSPVVPVTTAPIYLPYYNESSWSAVRGSVVASDPKANLTTYTIFCPTQTTNVCKLAINFPFVFTEGPKTVQFHGTYTSTFIANIGCNLNGTTAAACSGYTSLTSGYTMGKQTGPTEIRWTSTFSDQEVQWGALTLTDVPTNTDESGGNGAAATGVQPTNTALYYVTSQASKDGAAARPAIDLASVWLAALATGIIGILV